MYEDEDQYDEDDCPRCGDSLSRHVISRKYSEELGVGFVKWCHVCYTCGFRTAPIEEEI
jgi:predicted RNA-binding Zn-ribbon protein involved in translation (DUF1610 family)